METGIRWHESDRRGPKLIAIPLDAIVFLMSLTVDWLTVQPHSQSPLRQKPYHYLTVIWLGCKIYSEDCAAGNGWLANITQMVSSLGYNLLNASFLSSSILLVLRLVALQPELSTFGCGFNWLAHEFLRGFLPTAFIGEAFVMLCLFAQREELIRHEAKLYILCLYLGWVCSIIAWIISNRIRLKGRENTRDQVAVRKFEQASAAMLGVKTVWCFSFTAQTLLWFFENEKFMFGTKYHSLAFAVERVCASLTFCLLKKLAKLYSGLNDLPI